MENKGMIRVQDVGVRYSLGLFGGHLDALDGLNLTVYPGDVYGLLGPNGAGKTTAMHCLLGLIRPDRGRVQIFNETPEPGSTLFNRIAYVPEVPIYHPHLTVREALDYYASLYLEPIKEGIISEALERVGLAEFNDLRVERCSKGMKQKLGLASCLLKPIDLLLLDEPTRGLDPVVSQQFRDVLKDLNQQGTTIVMNSHVLSEIEMVCNRVAIMKKGKALIEDQLDDLLEVDLNTYRIELDPLDNPPNYFHEVERHSDRLIGLIPTDRVIEFFKLARDRDCTIRECQLKKPTLEEVFVDRLAEGTQSQ